MVGIFRRHRPGVSKVVSLAAALGTAAAMTAVGALAAPSIAGATPRHAPALRNFTAHYSGVAPRGELDCNGFSPVQKSLRPFACTDIRGFDNEWNQNTWGGRFYDNGVYIGHDEPDTTFLSTKPGSGGDVNWNLTLGTDPSAAPTGTAPGRDVSHWFELSPAPWLSMALCDGNSYPQLPCTPNSDSNAPRGAYPGGGSAFMEMQFYPPGAAPWIDNVSCDGTHWCAALTIDSLECTAGFAQCNNNCVEPVNFAFVQTNGAPVGGPSPQDSTLASYIPDAETLYMNPGDKLSVHMSDAPVPGEPGQKALQVVIDDLSTGQSGSMQASAKNGFENTSILNCSGTPFNFEPEYSTASVGNYIPWAALQTDISTEFETGHFEPCSALSEEFTNNPFDPYDRGGAGGTSGTYNVCSGPYERAGGAEGNETGDALCYLAGDQHNSYDGAGGTVAPNLITGCQDNTFQNGDLDYDGTPYWTEWPTSTTAGTYPGSFVESMPTSGGSAYPRLFFQSDAALSEGTCASTTAAGCTIPPAGPGRFYPYWAESRAGGTCTLEFGNVSNGVQTFGRDAQYGTVQWKQLGYPEFMGKVMDNTCPARPSQGYALLGRDGAVLSAGDAPPYPAVHAPSAPVVGLVATPDAHGYYAVTDTGVVTAYGDASFFGDLTTLPTPVKVSDIVAVVPDAAGDGYWLVGADGGVYTFGRARYVGSLPGLGIHRSDVVGVVAGTTRSGYLMVTSDGAVFAFGTARYRGSLTQSGMRVDDVRAAAGAPGGTGYLLLGADGGVFAFGTGYHGSVPGSGGSTTAAVGIAPTTDAGGYWIVLSSGRVLAYGDAGTLPGPSPAPHLPITAISTVTTASPIS